LLLEVISGKLSYSEEQGHLENWVSFVWYLINRSQFLPLTRG
jgi:hypothetical protein